MKHYVLFKLKESDGDSRISLINAIKTMKPELDMIESLEVYEDFLHSERSYDVMLMVEMAKDKLDEYQNHPAHLKAKADFAPLIAGSITLDTE